MKTKEIRKKQKIGLGLAFAYWIIIFLFAYLGQVYVESMKRNVIGGEIFLVPAILLFGLGCYNYIIAPSLRQRIYRK